jgi:hypothetical protein
MQICLGTSDSITLELAGAVSADQPEFIASYIDTTTDVPGSTKGETNDTTPVTAVAAPAADQRLVYRLDICNIDSAEVTVILKAAGGTGRTVIKHTLAASASVNMLDLPPASSGGGVTDHGALTGLSDDDHDQYLLATGTRAGSSSQAQSFGAAGIKADVVEEHTGAAGVTVDGLKIKDAGLALGSDADGDIYYRASGALARLAKGSALQGLRMNAGATAPEYTYPAEYVALVKPSGNQSIAPSTSTKVALGTELLDRGSAFASDRFTVASGKGGVYVITYQGNLASLAAGKTLNFYLYKNGSSDVFLETTVGAAGNIALAGCKMLELAANDYIELYVWHNDSTDRTLLAAGTYLNVAGPF